jgi:hypothetical protein
MVAEALNLRHRAHRPRRFNTPRPAVRLDTAVSLEVGAMRRGPLGRICFERQPVAA